MHQRLTPATLQRRETRLHRTIYFFRCPLAFSDDVWIRGHSLSLSHRKTSQRWRLSPFCVCCAALRDKDKEPWRHQSPV